MEELDLSSLLRPIGVGHASARSFRSRKLFLIAVLFGKCAAILSYYQKRWPVEIDNFYLKEALGLRDFRLQSFEAIHKWFAVVILEMNHLQVQTAKAYLKTHSLYTPADLIRQHRLAHFRNLLRKVILEALRTGKIDEVIESFVP